MDFRLNGKVIMQNVDVVITRNDDRVTMPFRFDGRFVGARC